MAWLQLWCVFVVIQNVQPLTIGHTGLATSGDGGTDHQIPTNKECCTRLPGLCNEEKECLFDDTTCASMCSCNARLSVHVCKAMVQDLLGVTLNTEAPQNDRNENETQTSFITTSFTQLPSSEHTHYVSPSPEPVSVTSGILSTPSLDLVPSSVSIEVTSKIQKHRTTSGYDIKHVTPAYKRQTLSTDFNESMVGFLREKNISPEETSNSSIVITNTLEPASAAERPEDTEPPQDTEPPESTTIDYYANFVPPVMDTSSNCDNCTGRCIMEWSSVPVLRCVEREADDDMCNNFACGEHGDCVISGDGLVRCECHGNYTGTFCDDHCDLQCGEMGTCIIMNGTKECNCNWNFTGEGCSETRTTPAPLTKVLTISQQSEPWTVIGICVGLTLLMFLLMVVLPYWGWRRRWLPMRKLVYYFQQYEDDDGREFDAFISYKSTEKDEDFVVHKLYPKLEKELDFKLCMHFRDFPPGAAIADNIIEAIEKSRRTIMILSRAYVESEWCRLEYQKAQHEMLKRKHKIIPILLEDVSEVTDMDKNLKQIIDTVTYIKWPGDEKTKELDKFWKLMVCALPKKKKDTSQSETSGNGSSSSDLPLTSVAGSHFPEILSDDVFSEKGERSSKTIDRVDKGIFSITKSYDNDVYTLYNDAGVVKNNDNIPKSDDHIIEIRKLPGNELKVFHHLKLDFPM